MCITRDLFRDDNFLLRCNVLGWLDIYIFANNFDRFVYYRVDIWWRYNVNWFWVLFRLFTARFISCWSYWYWDYLYRGYLCQDNLYRGYWCRQALGNTFAIFLNLRIETIWHQIGDQSRGWLIVMGLVLVFELFMLVFLWKRLW